MRGIFTAGVLDVLMEAGLGGFDSVWGVSAGALNAVGFKSGQVGRSMRTLLAFRDDRRFMSVWSFVTTGDIASVEFVYDTVLKELDPCDEKAFASNPMDMYVVVSDVTFGRAVYLPVRDIARDGICVRASASLPGVSNIVEINGHRYLDGGTTDSVPFEVALGLPRAEEVAGYTPADRAVVVLTQHRAFVKDNRSERIALRTHRYEGFPYFVEALRTRTERYMAQRERLWQLEREGCCVVIAPERPVEVSQAEHEGEPLLELYLQGRRAAEAALPAVGRALGVSSTT